MSIFDLFKPTRPDMSALARRQSPQSRRLTALRSYRDLSKAAQGLVKAVLLDRIPPFEACKALPNGTRLFESQAVQRCLLEAGWQSETRSQAPKVALEADSDGFKAPRNDPQLVQAPLTPPTMPQRNVESTPEPACEVCGKPSSGSFYGRQLCPRHGAAAVSGVSVTAETEAATMKAAAIATPAIAPTSFPERDGRCRSCGLVICNCGRKDYAPPDAQVVLADSGGVNDLSQLYPYITDDNKAMWRQQIWEENVIADAYERFGGNK